jgi:flagellar biosynthetic protein FliR
VLTFSEAQLMSWLSPVIWPFLRVLALFSVAPIFSQRSIPTRAKVGLAFLVALSAQASLSGQPVVSVNGPEALGTAVQQIAVGVAIGFAVRIVFAAVELAGELVGLQMGLNFAAFFDPSSNAQTSAVSRFFGNMAVLLFIAINGHLMVLMAVVRSFESFPVDGRFVEVTARLRLYELGADMFASALWLALPMVALLLFVNLALGIVSRLAPQMNIYAIGFPVTLMMGLVGIVATLPMMEVPMLQLMQRMLDLFTTR